MSGEQSECSAEGRTRERRRMQGLQIPSDLTTDFHVNGSYIRRTCTHSCTPGYTETDGERKRDADQDSWMRRRMDGKMRPHHFVCRKDAGKRKGDSRVQSEAENMPHMSCRPSNPRSTHKSAESHLFRSLFHVLCTRSLSHSLRLPVRFLFYSSALLLFTRGD